MQPPKLRFGALAPRGLHPRQAVPVVLRDLPASLAAGCTRGLPQPTLGTSPLVIETKHRNRDF